MAVWSVVQCSNLALDIRLDAEYYQPKYIEQEAKLELRHSRKLEEVASVSDGNHLTISDQFTDEGIRYLRGQDLTNFFISDSNPIYIPREEYESLERSHIQVNDVLLSIVGTVGSVAIVTDKYNQLTGSCKIAIIRSTEINPWFLAGYFASDIGQSQVARRVRGAVQQGLILPDLRDFPVPDVSPKQAVEIELLIKKSLKRQQDSEALYAEAEALLIQELDLNIEGIITPKIYAAKQLSEVMSVKRFDAEYWNPIHIENEKVIERASQKFPVRTVYELTKKVTGSAFYPSISGYYSEIEGMPFIRVSDIGQYFVDSDLIIRLPPEIVEEIPQIATVKGEDIVVAKGGSIGGVCLVQPELGTCAVSRDVIAVHADQEKINSLYLIAFLKSKIGQIQLDRNKSQQVQPHLTFPAIGNVKVIVPPIEKQFSVAQHVLNAHEALEESKMLLETAKKRIEIMIQNRV